MDFDGSGGCRGRFAGLQECKLTITLKGKGYDILHTDDLPNKKKSTDKEIRRISVDQDRIVITKDSDFLDSHLIQGGRQNYCLLLPETSSTETY